MSDEKGIAESIFKLWEKKRVGVYPVLVLTEGLHGWPHTLWEPFAIYQIILYINLI